MFYFSLLKLSNSDVKLSTVNYGIQGNSRGTAISCPGLSKSGAGLYN